MPKKAENKVTIKIPRPLYNRLKKIIDGSGFDSVTDFVVYLLRDIAASHVEANGGEITDIEQLTPDEVKKVRDRLQKLGYL